MSTTAMVSYQNPNQNPTPFQFVSRACFGTMNCLNTDARTDKMEVMEWHPQSGGRVGANNRHTTCTPRKAFNFVNSFGMWKDIFHMTTINTVAADLTKPIDAVITGFMSLRDFQETAHTHIFQNEELSLKIEFALYVAGIYRARYSDRGFLGIQSMGSSEGSVCSLQRNDDAVGLYLLAFGTKEQFEGCWAQEAIGQHPSTRRGYIRDSSDSSRRNHVRNLRPGWSSLSCWLRSWLTTQPASLEGKLGRLTVHRFYDGLVARLSTEPSANEVRKAAIIAEAFEELREMYE